jgi:hypothetical protein
MKYLLSKEVMAVMVLDKAIKEMQRHILQMQLTQYAMSPADAVANIQQGLADAAELAKELLPRNFDPDEIRRQRRAIRKAMGNTDLE